MIRAREHAEVTQAHRRRKEAACPYFDVTWDAVQTEIAQNCRLLGVGTRFRLLCDTLPVPLVRSHGSDDHGLKENSPLRMRCIKSIAVIMASAFANDLNPAIETPSR